MEVCPCSQSFIQKNSSESPQYSLSTPLLNIIKRFWLRYHYPVCNRHNDDDIFQNNQNVCGTYSVPIQRQLSLTALIVCSPTEEDVVTEMSNQMLQWHLRRKQLLYSYSNPFYLSNCINQYNISALLYGNKNISINQQSNTSFLTDNSVFRQCQHESFIKLKRKMMLFNSPLLHHLFLPYLERYFLRLSINQLLKETDLNQINRSISSPSLGLGPPLMKNPSLFSHTTKTNKHSYNHQYPQTTRLSEIYSKNSNNSLINKHQFIHLPLHTTDFKDINTTSFLPLIYTNPIHTIAHLKTLHVTIIGSGAQPMIIVHGVASSANFFLEGLIQRISPYFIAHMCTFYLPDMMGYGQSVDILANENYKISEQASRIYCDVIQFYQLDSYHILGHSYGGAVAIALAAIHPKNVATLTLLSPAYFESIETAKEVMRQAPFPCPWIAEYPELGRCILHLLSAFVFLIPTLSSIVPKTTLTETALRELVTTEPEATLGSIATMITDRIDGWITILQAHQVRILLLQADHDIVVPSIQGRKMALRYPNVVYKELSGTGHLFPQSHATQLAAIIEHEVLRWNAKNKKKLDDWIIP